MRRFERAVMYTSVALAATLGIGHVAGLRLVPSAGAEPALPALPDAAKIAVCDVHQLVERLVGSDQYTPALKEELTHVNAQLAPLEQELGTMQKELQASNPQDPTAQEKYKAFAAKRDEYGTKRQTLIAEYNQLLAAQFVEAYGKVCAEARKQGAALGYTYVLAHKRAEMKGTEPLAIVEDFLARPVILAPDNTDITEQVRVALKLPDGAPGATPMPGGLSPGAPGSPEKPVSPAPTPSTPK